MKREKDNVVNAFSKHILHGLWVWISGEGGVLPMESYQVLILVIVVLVIACGIHAHFKRKAFRDEHQPPWKTPLGPGERCDYKKFVDGSKEDER